MSSASAAVRYIDRGYAPVPIPARSKAPNLKGWQHLRMQLEDVPKYFHNGTNIGILLGEPSGGLVDLDLDCSEAVAAARYLLPDTLRSGRESSPNSHYWYRCEPVPATAKFQVPRGGAGGGAEMFVECRSTGKQTVVAPSIHPDGDKYTWGTGAVATISGPELLERAREVATAALLARHWPSKGRHEITLAAAGYLGRRLAPGRVQPIIEAVCGVAGDAEWRDRSRAVADTLEGLQAGREVTGGPALDQLAPGVPALLTKWWGWSREAGGEQPHNDSDFRESPTSTNRTQPMTAAELMAMTFEPTRWVVPDVLPEGLSLLVGKPKKGKSWMALGMCEAVACGGVAFGTRRVEQGDTLYLALEDNQKRLQKRLKKILNGAPPPERMHLHISWPRLDAGGAELLDEWLTEHPGARLVVIDTLAKIRQPARGSNIYAEDYAALEKLLPLASKHGVAIVVVHHLRKMAASDPADEISSSTGLTAGVDGFLILRRTPGSKGPTLFVDGRDIEEPTEWALHWNINTATWTIEGDAEEVHVSKERADILLTLNRNGAPMTPKEVTDATGAKYNSVKKLMWTMLGDGQLLKNDKFAYYPANPTTPGNHGNHGNPGNHGNHGNPTAGSEYTVTGLPDGLPDDDKSGNPTFSDTYAGNGDRVTGVTGVTGVGGVSEHDPTNPMCLCDECVPV
jgi:hypothetical protein